MPIHESINYLEFPCRDLTKTKAFFADCFGWIFEDYGPEYTSFSLPNLDGGFFQADLEAAAKSGSVLVVFYSDQLDKTRDKVVRCGGKVVQQIFDFPGGRRFHFTEPSGNEFAVWGKSNAKPETV